MVHLYLKVHVKQDYSLIPIGRYVVDNFIILVNYVKTCSEVLPCDPSFQRVPWDACVRREQSAPGHVTKQGARDTTGAPNQCHATGYITTEICPDQ